MIHPSSPRSSPLLGSTIPPTRFSETKLSRVDSFQAIAYWWSRARRTMFQSVRLAAHRQGHGTAIRIDVRVHLPSSRSSYLFKPMQVLGWFNWRFVLIFASLGPFVGAIPRFLGFAQDGAAGLDSLVPVILCWAYLFGLLPATIAGLVLPAILRLLPLALQARLPVELLAIFLIGLIVCWIMFIAFTPFNAVYFALTGGASASVCALVARWVGVGPSISIKSNRPHEPA